MSPKSSCPLIKAESLQTHQANCLQVSLVPHVAGQSQTPHLSPSRPALPSVFYPHSCPSRNLGTTLTRKSLTFRIKHQALQKLLSKSNHRLLAVPWLGCHLLPLSLQCSLVASCPASFHAHTQSPNPSLSCPFLKRTQKSSVAPQCLQDQVQPYH